MEFTPGIQGWFSAYKPVFIIYQINKIKNKNHLNNCKKKGYEKIQHPFVIVSINKLGIEEMYLNKIKTIYEKPIANIPVDQGITLAILYLSVHLLLDQSSTHLVT